MKSDDLAARLRPYETASDRCVPPGLHLVARLDGRGFGRLFPETYPDLARPFDERARNLMIETARHLMTCGFQVVYGYTQSDEISLLLHPHERAFGRKLRKVLSILAGEASAKFSLLAGRLGSFDCRLSELPSVDLVVDYFRWRADDAARNALAAHCTWALRAAGMGEREASAALSGLGPDARHELLFRSGVHFGELPLWQRRGVGLVWERVADPAADGEAQHGEPRRISPDLALPMRAEYDAYVRAKLVLALTGGRPPAPSAAAR